MADAGGERVGRQLACERKQQVSGSLFVFVVTDT
jgi:hypothetical protein